MLFQENPFYLLHAHSTDGQAEISDLAEDACLDVDSDEEEQKYHQVENILLNPRKRIGAELFWLCGISKEIAYRAISNVSSIKLNENLQEFTSWNQFLMLFNKNAIDSASVSPKYILRMDQLYNLTDTVDLKNVIDQDRHVAHIASIQDELWINNGMKIVLEEVMLNIRKGLQNMGDEQAANCLQEVIEKSEINGSSDFMDALVQTYENSVAKNLIDAEGRCNEAIEYINNGNTYVGLIGLKKYFLRWAKLIAPLNLYNVRYFNRCDDRIYQIIGKLRHVAVTCNNERYDVETALEIFKLLVESFGNLPQVGEQLKKDKDFLSRLLLDKTKMTAENGVWTGKPVNIKRKGIENWPQWKKFLLFLVIAGILHVVVPPVFHAISNWKYHSTITQTQNNSTTIKEQNKTKNLSSKVEYQKPKIKGAAFSMSEIRWAIREQIRLDTLKNMNLNSSGIDAYNHMVDEYNRCASEFKYRGNAYKDAKAEVEKERATIVREVQNQARNNGWIDE